MVSRFNHPYQLLAYQDSAKINVDWFVALWKII